MSAQLRLSDPASVITLRIPTPLLQALDAEADRRLTSRTMLVVRACEALMAALEGAEIEHLPLPGVPNVERWRAELAHEVERGFYRHDDDDDE